MDALTLLLRPDFVIASASEEYLRGTLVGSLEDIVGCDMFDVFPDNPGEPTADGCAKLRQSLEAVLRTGSPQRMTLQRYDVRDRIAGGCEWVEKFWLPENAPVFGSGSREIAYLLHRVVDVTMGVHLQRWVSEQALAVAEQRATLRRMHRDLIRRASELAAAQRQLANLISVDAKPEQFEAFQREFGAPERRCYFPPGSRVPDRGIYQAFHHAGCQDGKTRFLLEAGRVFAPCADCGRRVLYRLLEPLD